MRLPFYCSGPNNIYSCTSPLFVEIEYFEWFSQGEASHWILLDET